MCRPVAAALSYPRFVEDGSGGQDWWTSWSTSERTSGQAADPAIGSR